MSNPAPPGGHTNRPVNGTSGLSVFLFPDIIRNKVPITCHIFAYMVFLIYFCSIITAGIPPHITDTGDPAAMTAYPQASYRRNIPDMVNKTITSIPPLLSFPEVFRVSSYDIWNRARIAGSAFYRPISHYADDKTTITTIKEREV